MQLSIVLISHNRSTDLWELLDCITRFNGKHLLANVVVVDNGSTPAIKPYQMNDVRLDWIRSDTNLGAAGGRNHATTFATGDILVYFDDDALVEDNDILFKIADSFHENEGLIAFNVFYMNGQRQLDAFPHKNYRKYKDLPTFITYYYAACGYAIRRDVWNKIGGYPENFAIYMEEYDVSYRLINAGYIIKYARDIKILHKKSPVRSRSVVEETRLDWINKGRVAFKYLPRIYYYSTVVMWSLQFLLKSNFNLKKWFATWKVIGTIPNVEKRQPISEASMEYLRKVEARLWY